MQGWLHISSGSMALEKWNNEPSCTLKCITGDPQGFVLEPLILTLFLKINFISIQMTCNIYHQKLDTLMSRLLREDLRVRCYTQIAAKGVPAVCECNGYNS